MLQKALDLTEMWQAFCSRQENFVANYIAYHYYRSKGWVPRDGVKYGAHFGEFVGQGKPLLLAISALGSFMCITLHIGPIS